MVAQAYDFRQHGSTQADFAHLVPDEIVTRFAFSGEASAIVHQIRALEHCGVDEVVLAIPVAPKITPRDAVMRELGPMVLSMNAGRS
jgi:hypothetical protein